MRQLHSITRYRQVTGLSPLPAPRLPSSRIRGTVLRNTCLYSPVFLLSRFWGITRVQSLLYRVVPENSVPRTRMWQAASGPREFLLLICACVCVHACVCAHVFTCACVCVCVCESVRMWRPEVNSGATQKLSTFPPRFWKQGFSLKPGAC